MLANLLWCPLRVPHKNDGLCLQLFVGGSRLVFCVCLRNMVFNTYCVVCFWFVFLCLVNPKLPVSLECPFVIAPSVFYSVYSYYMLFSLCIKPKETYFIHCWCSFSSFFIEKTLDGLLIFEILFIFFKTIYCQYH